jgi:carbon-monoxide dehydrogenase medium subunit
MYEFKYHKASSLEEAQNLKASTSDGIYLAGGQTLIPTFKQRLAAPSDVIDLAGIEELRGISATDSVVSIGAMTRHAEVASSVVVREAIPALSYLAGLIGDAQVRNRGTIGGSVANSDPAADFPAAVVTLNSSVFTTQRTIAGTDFFNGLFETALMDGELITRLEFSVPDRCAYAKFPNPASRYAVVGVMIAEYSGKFQVGVTGAAGCAFRALALEDALNNEASSAAIEAATINYESFNNDMHASAEYRAQLVKVMARRALAGL